MTIPPQAFGTNPSLLAYEGVAALRTSSGMLRGSIGAMDAFCLAVQGKIEAVVSNGGKLRYFRELPDDVAAAIALELRGGDDDIDEGTSTAFARTNQGTFRERLREVGVDQDGAGFRRVAEEGGVSGFCYTHCALRGLKFKGEPRRVGLAA